MTGRHVYMLLWTQIGINFTIKATIDFIQKIDRKFVIIRESYSVGYTILKSGKIAI